MTVGEFLGKFTSPTSGFLEVSYLILIAAALVQAHGLPQLTSRLPWPHNTSPTEFMQGRVNISAMLGYSRIMSIGYQVLYQELSMINGK